MSNRGKDPSKNGWREDSQRPGLLRYWASGGWDDTIPPQPAPVPIWRQATAVAIGVLVALAALSVFGRIFG